MNKFSKFTYAVATLAGTIIGVGIFSLPYITMKVGLWVMLGYFLVLTVLVTLIHYFFGEVALNTPDFLRLPGYAKIYLGKIGKNIVLVSSVLGSIGSILAYIIIGGEFSGKLLSPFFGGNALFYTFLYFIFGALFVFWGIKAISKIEFWGMILFFISLFLIFLKVIPLFKIENLSLRAGNFSDIFLPYGPILFALSALTLIPEVEEILGEDKKLLKKVIPISILIPAAIYLFFIFLVFGVSGQKTSPEAISGLKDYLGSGILSVAFFAAILTTFTSFIAIALTLKKTLWYDLKIPKTISWAITCFIPFALFLLGFKDFIKVIGVVGGMLMAIDGVIILLMYQKIKGKKVRVLTYPLALIFILGLIYEIIYFIK